MAQGKYLYLMRHGEAAPGAVDFERTLTHRGRKQIAVQAAQFKLSDGIRPDGIFCSTAKRTVETVNGLQKLFKGVPVFYRETLYLAPTHRLLDLIRETDDIFLRLLIIGHNPGMEQLVSLIDQKGMRVPMETADCVEISLGIKSWGEIKPGAGKIEKIFRTSI